MRALNLTRNVVIAVETAVAGSTLARMKGLLGKKGMAAGEALLIKPCKGVHTVGMKFPIDVLFLDKENRVLSMRKNLRPNRATAFYLKAAAVLELPAGTLQNTGTEAGDEISIG